MQAKPSKPRWKRKRWIAAGVLALAVCYPLSAGPAAYAVGRGWLPGFVGLIHRPAFVAREAAIRAARPTDSDGKPLRRWKLEAVPWHLRALWKAAHTWSDYVDWCYHAGERHRRAASD